MILEAPEVEQILVHARQKVEGEPKQGAAILFGILTSWNEAEAFEVKTSKTVPADAHGARSL